MDGLAVTPMTYDFGRMLDELFGAGATPAQINAGTMTDRIIHHYRRGVMPLHWRGERIIDFWCEFFGRQRIDAPLREVLRGHRVDRRMVVGPRLQSLPQWPAAVPVSVEPIKMRKKPGPKPRKVAETV